MEQEEVKLVESSSSPFESSSSPYSTTGNSVRLKNVESSIWWKIGCALGALAIMFGAFGAHFLKKMLPKNQDSENVWRTAAHHQLVHSIVLLLVPFCRNPLRTGILFSIGIILFSGSLYAIVLTDINTFGVITPVGGVLLTVGWVSMAI